MKSVMLAASTDGKGLRYPLYASPKYDGVRCIIRDGKVLSRSFKAIPNKHVQQLFGHLANGLDGELIVGDPRSPTVFRDTNSAVMSKDGKPAVKLFVFDLAVANMPFAFRRPLVGLKVRGILGVSQIEHKLIQSEEELLAYEEWAVAQNYEGIMLNSVDGFYKQGRSTAREGFLMKLKRFSDSEARITGFIELEHNKNEKINGERSRKKTGMIKGGVLGAFTVKDVKTGVTFDVGSGFTAHEREVFWKLQDKLKGKLVKYRYFPTGSKTKPRFPTFQGFRSKIDM